MFFFCPYDKKQPKKNNLGRTGLFCLIVWGYRASWQGNGASRSLSRIWSHFSHNQEAMSNDCSANFLLLMQSKIQAHRMVPPIVRVGLSTSLNPVKITTHRHVQRVARTSKMSFNRAGKIMGFFLNSHIHYESWTLFLRWRKDVRTHILCPIL